MIVRSAQPIATQNKVSSDRRAIFASFDNEDAEVDMLQQQQLYRFGELRCVFIDTSQQNSTNGDGCVIVCDSGQRITVTAGTQGYYPLFDTRITKVQVSTNDILDLIFFDFDQPAFSWGTVNTGTVIPDPLPVTFDQPIASDSTIENWPINTVTKRIAIDCTVPSTFVGLNYVNSLVVALEEYNGTSRGALSILDTTFAIPAFTNANMVWLQLTNINWTGDSAVTWSAPSGASGEVEVILIGN